MKRAPPLVMEHLAYRSFSSANGELRAPAQHFSGLRFWELCVGDNLGVVLDTKRISELELGPFAHEGHARQNTGCLLE